MNLKEKPVVIDNNTYRYSKIVMLDTSKASLILSNDGGKLMYDKSTSHLGGYRKDIVFTPQHLYFLSSDKICEGDWYIDDCNQVRQSVTSDEEYWSVRQDYKKIIATTDKSLTFDDGMNSWFLPELSPEFIQKYIDAYNKGEKIEECLVEYEDFINSNPIWNPKNPLSNVVFRPKITKGEITIRKIEECLVE